MSVIKENLVIIYLLSQTFNYDKIRNEYNRRSK